ncbi:MAG: hypothetical protein QM662_15720, partial [Gordonia sp. (in: high G+C Gram-positive bacteria)]
MRAEPDLVGPCPALCGVDMRTFDERAFDERAFRESIAPSARRTRAETAGAIGVCLMVVLGHQILHLAGSVTGLPEGFCVGGLLLGILMAIASMVGPRTDVLATAIYAMMVLFCSGVLEAIRLVGFDDGAVAMPFVGPMAVLTGLVAAQLRTSVLVTTSLGGLAALSAAELAARPLGASVFFDLAAAVAAMAAALSAAFVLQSNARRSWCNEQQLAR